MTIKRTKHVGRNFHINKVLINESKGSEKLVLQLVQKTLSYFIGRLT